MDLGLTCYGNGIDRLADWVGDFDLLSATSTERWLAGEWERIAETLGFAQPFARARSRLGAAAAGVDAFGQVLARRGAPMTDNQARAQASVLQAVTTLGRARGELWRVTVDPTDLPGGACYDDEGQKRRAFEADVSPGYFGDGWPGPRPRAESACGWQTPLVMHLGTFPWVYGARLGGEGPGLRWASQGTFPAVDGLRLMASFFDPASNLQQDGRQVATIFAAFRAQTAPLLASVPAFRPGAAIVGGLYLRAGELHVHQGSLHLAGFDGPRGRLAAVAYNYCLRRFACFFAVRRAAVRVLRERPDLWNIALQSTDPCLAEAARASVGSEAHGRV